MENNFLFEIRPTSHTYTHDGYRCRLWDHRCDIEIDAASWHSPYSAWSNLFLYLLRIESNQLLLNWSWHNETEKKGKKHCRSYQFNIFWCPETRYSCKLAKQILQNKGNISNVIESGTQSVFYEMVLWWSFVFLFFFLVSVFNIYNWDQCQFVKRKKKTELHTAPPVPPPPPQISPQTSLAIQLSPVSCARMYHRIHLINCSTDQKKHTHTQTIVSSQQKKIINKWVQNAENVDHSYWVHYGSDNVQ